MRSPRRSAVRGSPDSCSPSAAVQRLEVRPTYVAALIENMRPLLRNVLGPGITKQFNLDHAMMPVMADPTQLEVAVLNLAINARDAMPDGGVLTFSSKPVRVGR